MPATTKIEYVIKLFKENWVRDFGLPKSIVSDRDVRFNSELWKTAAAAAEQGTQLQITSGNHPEANGRAEQLNRAVQDLLRHYIKPNQVDWDGKLALIASLYHNVVHSATGVSPNSLLLTFKPRLPLNFLLPENRPSAAPRTLEFAYRYERLMQQAVEQMHKAQAAMIESENKHRRPSTFQVGERVWVKSSELGQEHGISLKLMPQYFGPCKMADSGKAVVPEGVESSGETPQVKLEMKVQSAPPVPPDPLEAELRAQEEKLRLQAQAVENLKAELKKKEEAAQKEARRKILIADMQKIMGSGSTSQGCTIFSKIELKSGYHQTRQPSKPVQDWPRPANIRDVRSFLGLASYYRKFIKNFSAIAAPLTDLTKKDTSFLWTSECQEAFTRLKEALIRAPLLKLPDPTLPFVLTTDASQYGVGAVLQQDDGNGLQPIEYMSKKIKTKKLQDSTYEKELYALVSALKHWTLFLLGRHFKIFSYHSTLQWMKSQGELNDKLACYIQFIDMFDFELRHKKGCYNRVADALSRRPDALFLISFTHSFGERTRQTIAQLLPQDEIFGPIVRNLQDNPASEPGYTLVSGLLSTCSRGEERLCIPQDRKLRTLLMSECHDARGHFGALKSYAALSQRFF
ncbi:hypothetical protein CBR_g12136 [Chara braunii]|uniref:Integrase catalytic domain-containing protein n=1 Tax=Chara braunii TaxID=69332 RepID=A0A388KR98_CHABU|nr:hypothetical protein CBR_g12136 [Chara braunii]|eukprot:GBG72566.1 hypothetical protein CBR_g12136 [Chara braunii]